MRKSVVKGKLGRNEPVLLTSLLLNAPALYELVSLMGFHGVWMDLEHHPTSAETAEALMRASRVGNTDILARPAKGEMMRLGRLLEAGATGILYPRCSNAAEAEAVVRAAKFYPWGERGYDGSNPDTVFDDAGGSLRSDRQRRDIHFRSDRGRRRVGRGGSDGCGRGR